MAKAVRIGKAGQSTGVEPSLIHPGIGLQNIARPALAETIIQEAKWTSAAARRSPKTAPKTCCTEIRFTYPRRLTCARPGF